MDPEFGDGFPQLYLCIGLFLLVETAFWLESGRMMRVGRSVTKTA
jgi:hypothetical protein